MPSVWQQRQDKFDPSPSPMPDLIWKVINSRGLREQDEVEQFLSPSLKNLTSPFDLDGMDGAVERLLLAHSEQQNVMIYGDFDLDGSSGLSLLVEGFRGLGFENVHHYQPRRLSEGYGFHVHAVEKFKEQGIDLIVTVDVGITAIDAASKAKELGMDVIITDHHLPKETLPDALSVINPNKGTCPSQLGHLCGAGVGFYLTMAVRRKLIELGDEKAEKFNMKSLLDFFTIGTLTDMVPVIKENRILIKHGMKALAETPRPGLHYLLQELGLYGKPLTSQDVAIRFAPKLNALSRMDGDILPVDIFLERDAAKAKDLIKKVMLTNDKRVKAQRSAEKKAETLLKGKDQKGFVFVHSEDFHKGVIGLVATRLSQNFGVPAFVGSTDETGKISGSARLPSSGYPSLLDAMEFATDHLKQFGGHAPAAGFELTTEMVDGFEEKLGEFFHKFYMGEVEPVEDVLYDALCDFSEMTPEFMKWLEGLQPFGTDFEMPSFRFNELEVRGVRELRGGHLKLDLWDTKAMTLKQGLWFSPPTEHEVREQLGQGKPTVDVIAEPQWNYFGGARTLQLLIKDARLRVD